MTTKSRAVHIISTPPSTIKITLEGILLEDAYDPPGPHLNEYCEC